MKLLVKLKALDHKDVLTRALKTALAAALTTLLTTGVSYDQKGLITLGSAVVTAVINYVIQLLRV